MPEEQSFPATLISTTTLPRAEGTVGTEATAAPSKDILQMMTELLNKLPPLPEDWKSFFVKWYPWFLIVGAVLGAIGTLVALGLFSTATLFTLGGLWALAPYAAHRGLLQVVLGAINAVVAFLGGIQMRQMKISGWKLAVTSESLSIFSLLFYGGGLTLVTSLVAIYFLWQVKSRYSLDFT